MKEEYYSYDYWYDRYYNKENPISFAKQGLGNIGFEQYVVLFFTEEFPDHGNFFHPEFDDYLEVEVAKCDPKLVQVISEGINQTMLQVVTMYKQDKTGKTHIN